MKNILFLLSSSFLILFSCTTQQKVTFNEDWSGKVVTTIDMEMVVDFANEVQDTGTYTIFDDTMSRFQIENLKQIEGIKNVKIESSTARISIISYEFNDLNALNASAYLFSQESIFDPMHTFFKLNSKNELQFNLPRLKKDSNEEDSAGLNSAFKYQIDLEFPREIKSFTSESDSIVQKGKTLSIKSNLGLMMKISKAQKTVIKFK